MTRKPQREHTRNYPKNKKKECSSLFARRIYTPLGNLRKGVIVTDSKRYNFVNDSKKEEIIIPLDGEVTSTMKIEVTEYVTTPYDQMLGTNSCRGVIAEVELY